MSSHQQAAESRRATGNKQRPFGSNDYAEWLSETEYYNRLLKYARLRAPSIDSDNVVHDVLTWWEIRIQQGAATVDEEGDWRDSLFRILKQRLDFRITDELRKQNLKSAPRVILPLDIVDYSPSAESLLALDEERRWMLEDLDKAMEHLTDRQRLCVKQFAYLLPFNLTTTKLFSKLSSYLAEQLDEPSNPDSTRKLLGRAFHKLRKLCPHIRKELSDAQKTRRLAARSGEDY